MVNQTFNLFRVQIQTDQFAKEVFKHRFNSFYTQYTFFPSYILETYTWCCSGFPKVKSMGILEQNTFGDFLDIRKSRGYFFKFYFWGR